MLKKFIVIDTETCGINPAQCEEKPLLSLSGLEMSWDISNNKFYITNVFDYFFATEVEVPIEASQVNKLTKEIVNQRANNKFFEEYETELTPILNRPDAYCVGHNVKFDVSYIHETCMRYTNTLKPNYRGYVDTLQVTKLLEPNLTKGRHGLKLTEATALILGEKCGISKEDIVNQLKPFGFNIEQLAHTSIYDAACTALLLMVFLRENPQKFDELVKKEVLNGIS